MVDGGVVAGFIKDILGYILVLHPLKMTLEVIHPPGLVLYLHSTAPMPEHLPDLYAIMFAYRISYMEIIQHHMHVITYN